MKLNVKLCKRHVSLQTKEINIIILELSIPGMKILNWFRSERVHRKETRKQVENVKTRKRFNNGQLDYLRKRFDANKYPDDEELKKCQSF